MCPCFHLCNLPPYCFLPPLLFDISIFFENCLSVGLIMIFLPFTKIFSLACYDFFPFQVISTIGKFITLKNPWINHWSTKQSCSRIGVTYFPWENMLLLPNPSQWHHLWILFWELTIMRQQRQLVWNSKISSMILLLTLWSLLIWRDNFSQYTKDALTFPYISHIDYGTKFFFSLRFSKLYRSQKLRQQGNPKQSTSLPLENILKYLTKVFASSPYIKRQ